MDWCLPEWKKPRRVPPPGPAPAELYTQTTRMGGVKKSAANRKRKRAEQAAAERRKKNEQGN